MGSFFLSLLLIAGPVWAQTGVPSGPIDPTQRSGDAPTFEPLERPSGEGEGPFVPSPLPTPGEVDRLEGDQTRVGARKVELQRRSDVRFDKATEKDIGELIDRYNKKTDLSLSDLQVLRQQLTLLIASPDKAIGHGYVNSGAVLLDPGSHDGVATFEIVGGEIGEIQLNPTQYFAPFYLRQRLKLGSQTPFNIHSLQDRLQRLLQTPGVARLNTEIQPGSEPGEASLHVNVEEKVPFFVFLEFNNFQNPSVGAERGLLTLLHQNFTGLGDALNFTYGRSDGTDPLVDVSYTLPFTPWDTTLQFGYRKNDTMVVEAPFEPLNIELDSDVYSMTLRQPYYFSLDHEVAFSVGFEHLRNQNFLLGEGFPFFAGATSDGKQVISALRFGQEWMHRGRWDEAKDRSKLRPAHVVSFRSRFSWGIDALGATINSGNVPSGRFFSWLGQLQGVLRITPFKPLFEWFNQSQLAQILENTPIQLLSRMDLQLADRDIFPLEEYAMGGRFTVRGYRENTLVRDNAFFFSVEARIPVITTGLGQPILQVAPFIDVGRSWNTDRSTPDPQTLASIGLGLLCFIPKMEGTTLQVYWGQRLNHVDNPHNNTLQDYGFHVQFTLQALPLSEMVSEFISSNSS